MFCVGGDAYIAPLVTTPEQSEKRDTPMPSGPRADEGIGPYVFPNFECMQSLC